MSDEQENENQKPQLVDEVETEDMTEDDLENVSGGNDPFFHIYANGEDQSSVQASKF